MRNNTLPSIAKVFGFIVAMMLMQSSQAVQITVNLPDCLAGQTLGFNTTTNTLSCTGTITPVNTPGNCAITASPATTPTSGVAAGTNVSLTAACTTGLTPVSYAWNIGIAGISSFNVSPSQTTTYTVTPTNSAGAGTPFSVTVYVGNNNSVNPPPTTVTAPSGCSITQTPNTVLTGAVASGTQVTLQMTCSGGSTVTGCAWSNAIPGTACTVAVAPSLSTGYSATASNSAGSSSAASTTVYITPVDGNQGGIVPPPVDNTGQNFCNQSGDQIISVPWPALGQSKQSTNGFGNGRLAFKIVIPTSFNPALNVNHVGLFRIAEVPGSAVVTRDYTVSKNACDFQSNSYIYNGIGASDTAPTLSFTVNNLLGYLATGAAMNMNAGDTVYVNIRNYNGATPTCPYSACNILLDMMTPNRY